MTSDRILCLSTHVLAALLLASSAFAKRAAPKPVPPLVHNGVRYEAPLTGGKIGTVEAWDVQTGKLLWSKRVYVVTYDPKLERDVQDVHVTSLAVRGDKLIVTNESGDSYEVALGPGPDRLAPPAIQPPEPPSTQLERSKPSLGVSAVVIPGVVVILLVAAIIIARRTKGAR